MQNDNNTKQLMEKENNNIVLDLLNDADPVERYLNTTCKALSKDKDVRCQAVAGIFKFITKCAMKICRSRQEVPAYVQAAVVKLLEVHKKFDPEKGYRFSTFAGQWIRKAFQELEREGIMVPLSVHDMERRTSIKILAADFERENNREPDMEELMDLIRTRGGKGIRNLTLKQVKYLLGYSPKTVPFDSPLRNDPDSPTLGDTLVDPYTLPAYMYVA